MQKKEKREDYSSVIAADEPPGAAFSSGERKKKLWFGLHVCGSCLGRSWHGGGPKSGPINIDTRHSGWPCGPGGSEK